MPVFVRKYVGTFIEYVSFSKSGDTGVCFMFPGIWPIRHESSI